MATSDRTDSSIQIQLTHGYLTVIDAVDADLAQSKWVTLFAGNGRKPNAISSRSTDNKNRHALLHRIILERKLGRRLSASEYCDHIDGDCLNNRRDNIRLATPSQNSQNRAVLKGTKSGLKGACWDEAKQKWSSSITVDGTRHFLGCFDDAELAHQAYVDAANHYFGEFTPTEDRLRNLSP